MDRGRGSRGFFAALTVALTLTLLLLALEKHLREDKSILYELAVFTRAASTSDEGIVLSVDPGLAGVEHRPRTDEAKIKREPVVVAGDRRESINSMRRPPEPAANVVLQEPISSREMLPLHSEVYQIDDLMSSMDRALESPITTVSSRVVEAVDTNKLIDSARLNSLPSPAALTGRIPHPKSLEDELGQVEAFAQGLENSRYVSMGIAQPANRIDVLRLRTESQEVQKWISDVRAALKSLVDDHGLEHPQSSIDLAGLGSLIESGKQLGDSLSNHELATDVHRLRYSLARRVAIWNAIRQCINNTSIGLTEPRSPRLDRSLLANVLREIDAYIDESAQPEAWRAYLMLPELEAWAEGHKDDWQESNQLALQVLSRLNWQRLTKEQREFLDNPAIQTLAEQLTIWGRDPIDYRQLLMNVEEFEQDDISRVRTDIAEMVQVLRNAAEPSQTALAKILNDHYRNANLRVSVSKEMISRMLPEAGVEIRPIRQRILGADTRGDSALQTKLDIQLVPDDSAWNVGLGVISDMTSRTRSSKGPAVFHSTSNAQISSRRFLRLDTNGYQVTAEPTNVATQDYLRRMSTDFDSFPIVGDFARLIAREQFDQKRGLAQRITRRLIARETDAELDRRLDEGVKSAEHELTQKLIGPLEKLSLNPIVVSMNTTETRLAVRYRVASMEQMAAHTARPRAPTNSLMSLQLHQSAINNAIDRIGLSGRVWSIQELYSRIGEVFQQTDWILPADVPTDITIRFADKRPASVEFEDGRLKVTLRIAEFKKADQLNYRRFTVSTYYTPAIDGLRGQLQTDGTVEVNSRRDRFKIRAIFTKVFVSQSTIPLVAEEWAADPRAEGLAISQLMIRDGWLGLAVSAAEQLTPMVARQPQAIPR